MRKLFYVISVIFAFIAVLTCIFSAKAYIQNYEYMDGDIAATLWGFFSGTVPYIAYTVITFGIAKILPSEDDEDDEDDE